MLSQILPVPGSIKKYLREKMLQRPRVLAVLISRLCTADSAILVVFRGSLYSACVTSLYIKHVWGLYCGYCEVLAVFSPVGAASTANTRSSTKILSLCRVYWEYEVYFDHLSVHRRFDNFMRILSQTALTIHGWSHEWELKQITFGGGDTST